MVGSELSDGGKEGGRARGEGPAREEGRAGGLDLLAGVEEVDSALVSAGRHESKKSKKHAREEAQEETRTRAKHTDGTRAKSKTRGRDVEDEGKKEYGTKKETNPRTGREDGTSRRHRKTQRKQLRGPPSRNVLPYLTSRQDER